MDLGLSRSELAFLERLRAWLDAVAVPEGLRDFGSTPTADDIGPARAWQRLLSDGGWAGLSWPGGSGGAAATPVEQALFAEELAARGLPRQASFVSVELAGPAVIAHGTGQQRTALLPPMLTGAHVWCQLFSEPGAGSDLAALATRAVETEDGWAVTGQKVWTSGAHYADLGLLLARTGGAGHGGITCFVVPMDRPGIQVRPIRQLDGEEKFNEVFLDAVPVGARDVLGAVGGGWQVAVSILGRERRMLGSVAIALRTALGELVDRVAGDAALRRRWAALAIDVELLRWTWLRLLADERGPADPRTSTLKLTASRLQREVPDLARDAWGPAFLTDPAAEAWRARLLAAFGASIAGGTSEIQRTILATRVLALPGEDVVDFGLTEEQIALRATVAGFLAARAPVGGSRAALDGGAAFHPGVWRELAGDLGLAGLDVPEELGGAGGSTVDLVVAAEVLGAGLYGGPFLATTGLAVGALLEAGGGGAVGELVAGEQVAALVDGVRVGAGGLLEGAAEHVLHGAAAGVLVVVARDAAEREVVAVLDATAAEVVPHATLDATRPLARVELSGARATVVGEVAAGRWRDRAATILAAEALGNATAGFDAILTHLRTREQFGRPIGTFQALQHRCADLAVQLELARTAVQLAAWEVGTRSGRAGFAAAAALVAAGRAAHDVARASVQLHGGLGFTWEHDAHLRLRRAEVDRLLLAGEGALLDRCFAEAVRDPA